MTVRHKINTRLGFESLEPRLALSASSLAMPVGDAEFVVYDGAAFGTMTVGFSRDSATLDGDGSLIGAETPRFGLATVGSTLEWSPTDTIVWPIGSARVLASGWDSDGVTPLLVVNSQTANRVQILRGYDFELVGSLLYANTGLIRDGSTESIYRPTAAVVHQGLIVFATERLEIIDGSPTEVGVSFIYTQDYGQTLSLVPQVGGGFDVPPIAGGVTDGMRRGREWAFANPFPAEGLDDTTDVWFPWADYLQKSSSSPRGGQIGLFRATRVDESSPWVIQPNRVVFEQWIEEDSGGFHSHTAAITSGGVISHWGDVGYRNQTLFHEFPLDDYTTAEITTSTLFGGYDSSGVIYRDAPQPVGAAPAPTPGEHFASGDLTREGVLLFSDISSADERLQIDAPVRVPLRTAPGGVFGGPDLLHLQYLQGQGYISGGGSAGFRHFSPDGEQWVEVNSPASLAGRIWLFGDRLVAIDSDLRLWSAARPDVTTVSPLRLQSGGTNLLAPTLEPAIGQPSGVTVRELVYTPAGWEYVDTGEKLDDELDPPPGYGPYYEFEVSTSAQKLGQYWLQTEAGVVPLDAGYHADLYIANLSQQSIVPQVGLVSASGIGSYSSMTGQQIAETGNWVSFAGITHSQSASTERTALALQLSKPSPGTRFVVAPTFFGNEGIDHYPIPVGATAPNEASWVDFDVLDSDWGVGMVLRWNDSAPMRSNDILRVATLEGTNGDEIQIAARYTSATSTRWAATWLDNGIAVASVTIDANVMRGETVHLLVSQTDDEVSLAVRAGTGRAIYQSAPIDELDEVDGMSQLHWTSDGSGIAAPIEPILFVVATDTTIDNENQQAAISWLDASLYDKLIYFARPEPGDFNFDGSVDAGDYTVFRDTLGQSAIRLAADGDGNGIVDAADYLVWRSNFGRRDPTPQEIGDYNFDGSVDAADYTVFRDTLGQTGNDLAADGDGNGVVDGADYLVWRNNFGRRDPIPQDIGDYNFDGLVDSADYAVFRDTLGQTWVLLGADGDGNGIVDAADYSVWRNNFGRRDLTLQEVLATPLLFESGATSLTVSSAGLAALSLGADGDVGEGDDSAAATRAGAASDLGSSSQIGPMLGYTFSGVAGQAQASRTRSSLAGVGFDHDSAFASWQPDITNSASSRPSVADFGELRPGVSLTQLRSDSENSDSAFGELADWPANSIGDNLLDSIASHLPFRHR